MSADQGPRDRLLDAADLLMVERGYEAAGVADLCRQADVRRGSFYHFFDSKQQLAIEMLERAWARTRTEVFGDAFGSSHRGALESIQRYGDLLADSLCAIQARTDAVVGCRVGNLAVELSARDEDIRRHVAHIFDEMRALIGVAIERGVASGELRADLAPLDAATDVVAQMEGLMVLAKAHRDPDILRRLGPTAQHLLTQM